MIKQIEIQNYFTLNQDLSYDESLSGQPGAWLVKKLFGVKGT